jgi:hypothetical protein
MNGAVMRGNTPNLDAKPAPSSREAEIAAAQKRADQMITEGYWVLEDGRILSLFTPEEIHHLPHGTVLHTLKGVAAVVGRDVIDFAVHLGYGQFVENTDHAV